MAGDSEPPEGGKLGKGTEAKARIGGAGDVPPGTIPGNKAPPYDVVGTDALSPLLERVEFPATKADLVERLGDARIPVSSDEARPVREVLAEVSPDRFESSGDVERAVKARWDRIADREGRGGRHPQRDNLQEKPADSD